MLAQWPPNKFTWPCMVKLKERNKAIFIGEKFLISSSVTSEKSSRQEELKVFECEFFQMGRNICKEERCKKVDAQRIGISERGGRKGRIEKRDIAHGTEKRHGQKMEITSMLQTTKLQKKNANDRYIKVIGLSLDPSTLCGQNKLFIVKDCILPSLD